MAEESTKTTVTKGKPLSMKDIFEECAKHSVEQRRAICEEFISDASRLIERMEDLFSVNPGVLMMYGVSVKIEVSLCNDVCQKTTLGNPDVYTKVLAMSTILEEETKV